MFGKLEIFQMAQGMATNASARQSVLARNIAHADTPGYKARDIDSFAQTYQQSDHGFEPRHTRAGHLAGTSAPPALQTHIVTDAAVAPNGNSVSLETEMMKAVEARHQHDLALTIYRSTLSIMRTSVSR